MTRKLTKTPPKSGAPDQVLISRIVRSKRRTLALIVEQDGSLIVRAPNRLSRKLIDEFVAGHSRWIARKRAEIRANPPPAPRQYSSGEVFQYLGERYALELVRGQEPALILGQGFMLARETQSRAEQIFHDWYRTQARSVLTARVGWFAREYNFQYAGIRITSARTRWGSCNSKGALSFSWRLILAPMEVVDYVVVHELAHTVVHNHSLRFWQCVQQVLPGYKERRQWLKRHGPGLMQ